MDVFPTGWMLVVKNPLTKAISPPKFDGSPLKNDGWYKVGPRMQVINGIITPISRVK